MNEFGHHEQEKATAERSVERLGTEIRQARREGDFPKDVADKFLERLREKQTKFDSFKEDPENVAEMGDIRNELAALEKRVVTRSAIEDLNFPTGERGDAHPVADAIRKHLVTDKKWLEQKIAEGGPKTEFYRLALDTRHDAEGLAEKKVEANKVTDHNDAIAGEMLRIVDKNISYRGAERSVDDLTGLGLRAVKLNELPQLASLAERLRVVPRIAIDPGTGMDRETGKYIPVSEALRSNVEKLFAKLDLQKPENASIAPPDEHQFGQDKKQLADRARDLTAAYQKPQR